MYEEGALAPVRLASTVLCKMTMHCIAKVKASSTSLDDPVFFFSWSLCVNAGVSLRALHFLTHHYCQYELRLSEEAKNFKENSLNLVS